MKKTTVLLLLIIFIAAFLRFYQISENPKAMYGDGLTAVYDAYSILKTGHDQKGEFMPLYFRWEEADPEDTSTQRFHLWRCLALLHSRQEWYQFYQA